MRDMKPTQPSTTRGAALILLLALTHHHTEAWSPQPHQPRPALSQRHHTTRLNLVGGLLREAEVVAPSNNPTAAKAVAVSDADDYLSPTWDNLQTAKQPAQQFWLPVLSSAALITGNTFGAGSLVVPELAAGPGLAATSGVFLGAYLINLVSGLLLANISITQYETAQAKEGGTPEVPSSFQELALSNLKSQEVATAMSLIAFGVNALVLAFDISRVGVLFQGNIDPNVANTLWCGGLVALAATQTSQNLSQAASACVVMLFVSFGGLLLPGLASLTNPLGDWLAPGAAYDVWGSVADMAPVILMSMIFQNIVPTVAKLQDYDRKRTFTAMGLGSLMPLLMYVAWTWACLGEGGIDLAAVGLGGNPLLTVFSLATLAGSSIGCTLSCASEMDIFVKKIQKQEAPVPRNKDDESLRFQFLTVLATVGFPLGLCFAFANGGDFTDALHFAGGLGSPLLYGIIPAMMAYKQMQTSQEEPNKDDNNNMFGTLGLGTLGLASTTLFCENLMECVTEALPAVLPTAMEAVAVV